MAKAPEKQEGAEEQQPPVAKKKGKLLLLIAIGVVLLVVAGGGAAYLMLKKKPADEAADEEAGPPAKEAKADKGHPQKPPTYVKLDTFTTNLMPESPDQPGQYIQVMIELRVAEGPDADQIKGFMPEVRDRILRLLSSKRPSQLSTLEGKDALATEIRNTTNRIITPAKKLKDGRVIEPEGPVESVAFTSFIIQ